jgi:hypothetical protein
MNCSDIARLRLDNQRLSRSSFTNPVEVVRWFGAIQSQDLPGSLYAIGLRMRHATEALVERTLDAGSLVRSWPMRRTIHCMAAEDARWMVRALAPRGIARMKPYHRQMRITDDDLDRTGKVLESALARAQLTRSELYQRINDAGVSTATPGVPMRGLHLLVHWAQAGLICMAARRGKQPTFALVEEWTPRGRDLSGDDALAELAFIYMRSHAPATTKDFAWWTGLTVAEAKRALLLIGGFLKSVRVDGVEYWLMRDALVPPSGRLPLLLLPAFDEYTVAYRDRSVAADPSLLPSISNGLAANILVKGRIAGTWKRTLLSDGNVAVSPSPLRILNRKEQTELTQAAGRYAAFVGAKLVPGSTSHGRSTRLREGQ